MYTDNLRSKQHKRTLTVRCLTRISAYITRFPGKKMSETVHDTMREDFHRKYITSAEICKEVGVSKMSLMWARNSGWLPGEIFIQAGSVLIWERDWIRSFIDAWKEDREKQRRDREARRAVRDTVYS